MPQRSPTSQRPLLFGLFFLTSLLFSYPVLAEKTPSVVPPKKAKKTKKPEPYKDIAMREALHARYLGLMEQESKRYAAFFAKRPLPKVFDMRYLLQIKHHVLLEAIDGVIHKTTDTRNKPNHALKVFLRVGDHQFDQTGSDGADWSVFRTLLPIKTETPSDLSDEKLKKLLWQITDREYRVAFARYWRKRYVRSIKPKQLDKAGDFSKEPPTQTSASLAPLLTLDKKKWKGILRRVTKTAHTDHRILMSRFVLSAEDEMTLGIALDGSRVRLRQRGYTWTLAIQYLGKNKEFVSASRNGFVLNEQELPNEEALHKLHAELLAEIKARLQSEEGDPDEGPAIVDPMLAGAMFYDILMVRLSTGRFLRPNDERTFAKKLNQPILPRFLTVIDDPTQTHWGKTPLNSHYLFDDEWVPAQRLVMVEKGVLKNFYLSRKPYKDLKRSNGHGRAAFGQAAFARPGTTFVQSQQAFALNLLRKKLIEEAKRQGKPHAYILRRFSGTSQVSSSLYSATPDVVTRIHVESGKETQLKGLRIRSNAFQLLKSILATGDDYAVFNGADNEDSGNINIATVAPSLLLQSLTLTRYTIPEKKDFDIPPPKLSKK